MLKNAKTSPILLAGMHRSGTSWISDIIESSGFYITKDEEIFHPTFPMHKWIFPLVNQE